MTSRSRSLSGIALMLLIIPIFAGLLACMPVPIGDPERSRIDPAMTGIWVILKNEGYEGDVGFFVFEPYDKRTWLVMGIGIKSGDAVDLDDYDFSTYAGYEKLASDYRESPQSFYADNVILYKAWLTKLGGVQFWTWEPKGMVDALTEDPEAWWVYRVQKENENTLSLRTVDGEADAFDDIKKTRRAYERVLKKHANDPEIYIDDEEDQARLHRAEGEVLTFLEHIADDVIEGS
ncbi:MAG: hypothetical protein OEY74_05135 [Gammaproteobacteria bacterium]|nr:hypothetical protein [Gammaproteobacteria bacterium]